MKKLLRLEIIFMVLLIVLSLPAVYSLLHPGFFVSDDGDWMVIRFSAFHQALRDGQFPVRFLGRLNQEYGYPVANFLYPGYLYLAEVPKLLGFGFIDSIKIVLGTSLITSALFAYLWLRKLFDQAASLLGGLVYLYFPYHLFDVYRRGSVGEVLALAVMPFILWQIERRSFFWSSVGIGLLMISHNTLAVLFLPIVTLYLVVDWFVTKKNRPPLYWYIGQVGAGIGLSLFFWIPALFELSYTVFSDTVISQWQKYFADISLIGYPSIAIFLLVGLLFITKRLVIAHHRLTLFFFILGLTSLFFATSMSSLLWHILPVSFIQFPFRVLSVTIVATAFLAASAFSVLTRPQKISAMCVLGVFFIFASLHYSKPVSFETTDDGAFATNVATTTVANEYMPRWVQKVPDTLASEKVSVLSGKGTVADIQKSNRHISFTTTLTMPGTIAINTLYYPGWNVFVDGKPTQLSSHNTYGIMHIQVPAGQHRVVAKFGETPLRLTVDMLSVLTVVLLCGYELKRKWYGKKTH